MKNKIIVTALIAQIFNSSAYALNQAVENTTDIADQKISLLNDKLQNLCRDKNVNLDEVQKSSNKIWAEIADQANNASLSLGLKQVFKLTNRTSLRLGKGTVSEPSIGGNYSGIDTWDVSLSAILARSSGLDLGVTGMRRVTYIQQFPTRCQSLVRVAYDPITKLPISADRVSKRLNEGDFIAFKAPLVLSLGKKIKSGVNFSIYAAGEIDIHVFKMKNNYARVRFFASKSQGFGFKLSPILFGINSLTSQILKFTPAELFINKDATNLFTADYVFNFNEKASRDEYDQIMSRKFALSDFPASSLNPFLSENTMKHALYADLEKIDQIAHEDSKLDLNQRRIIRLGTGDNKTLSTSFGLLSDIILAKALNSSTYAESDVTQYNIDNEKSYYKIKSITEQSKYNILGIFGAKNISNNAFLLSTDEQYIPLSSNGLQSEQISGELNFSKTEMLDLQNRLRKNLPPEITEILHFPDMTDLKRDIKNTRIEQTLFLNAQKLETTHIITAENVRSELIKIIRNWGPLNSAPVNTENKISVESGGDPRTEDKDKGDKAYREEKNGSQYYLEAYSHELGLIPELLSDLFNTDTKPVSKKIDIYSELQGIPLFKEVGTPLMLNMIPKEILSSVLTYRLVITGRGIEPQISEYPKNGNLKSINTYNRVLNDNTILSDRSFNLRYFLNEKGEPKSLVEVVDQSK